MPNCLRDIAEVIMGQSPPGETCNTTGEGLPLLNGPTEFGSYHPSPVQFTTDPKRVSSRGDLLFCVRGSTTGRMNWSDQTYALGRGLAAIRPKNGNRFSSFLKGCIEVSLPTLLMGATGSTFPSVSREQIEDISVEIQSGEDLKWIENVLGTLDDKIELNRKTNETLEAMAKALFKSWFVDFDPVRAKAEGRPTGLPAEISDLFPDSFEDSELGEIPSGWEMEALGEILDVDKGVSYKGDFLSDAEGLPMVNLGCFAGGGSFRAEKMKFYTGEYRERHLATAGDLLVANTDMTQNRIILGAPIIVPSWRGRDKFLFSHHTFAIRFRRSKSAFTRFIYFTLLKPSFRQVAAGHATGTTVLALPKDGITDYQTVIPPAGLLNVFAAKVEALYQKCQALTEQCELLAKTRDALLPKLISGEIRIPDAERMLEEVGV